MSMPFMAAAQTNTMTDNGMITQTNKRPIPIISTQNKDTITSRQIALADTSEVSLDTAPEVIQPQEVIPEQPKLSLYNTNVDTAKVQQAWLGWINYERWTRGLKALELDLTLNNTSTERATYLGKARKFSNMHQRPGQACKNYRCYDLNERFAARWVTSSAGESVMFGGYSCKAEDCTTDLIETTRGRLGGPSGFLWFLLGEKRYNGVHYKMMMTPSYTKVGVGFAKTTHGGFGSAYVGVLHYSQ